MYDEFFSVYVNGIVDALRCNDFIFILHNCGNTGQAAQSMVSTGASGLHFGNKINLAQALKKPTDKVFIFGSHDPAGVVKPGTPENVFQESIELLKQIVSHLNFIISSGCDIPPGTSVENIAAFLQAVKSSNLRK